MSILLLEGALIVSMIVSIIVVIRVEGDHYDE